MVYLCSAYKIENIMKKTTPRHTINQII